MLVLSKRGSWVVLLNKSFVLNVNESIVPRIGQNDHHLNILAHVIKNCHTDPNLFSMPTLLWHFNVDEEWSDSGILEKEAKPL
jgi:hypothetical protein